MCRTFRLPAKGLALVYLQSLLLTWTAILAHPFSPQLEKDIALAYAEMYGDGDLGASVAVRSSATAEDLPNASFAGQQETYLNVQSAPAVIQAVKKCFASLFTDRAINYRVSMGFDHHQVSLSCGVQYMIRSEVSGVMFSIDTETGFKDTVVINASYGLGENIVQGSVTPDEFKVFKPTLLKGYSPVLEKKLGSKELKMEYASGGGKTVRNIPVPIFLRTKFCLSDVHILQLARWVYFVLLNFLQACIIEEHYSKVNSRYCPMDMEWCLDQHGELFIVQARPETVMSRAASKTPVLENYRFTAPLGKVLSKGSAVGSSIGFGKARVLNEIQCMADFQAGEVLVAHRTDPDWEPIMKKASWYIWYNV